VFQAFKAAHFADLSANNTMCGIIHVSMEVVATFTFLTVFNAILINTFSIAI
jgi:hypothetical protein